MLRIQESPRFKARIAGVFYLLNFVMGSLALFVGGRAGSAAVLIATAGNFTLRAVTSDTGVDSIAPAVSGGFVGASQSKATRSTGTSHS